MAATIGAAVGYAASLPEQRKPSADTVRWMIVTAGAISGSFLSFSAARDWHRTIFIEGTLAGIGAWPILGLLMILNSMTQKSAIVTFGSISQSLAMILAGAMIALLITVPCGWLGGSLYYLTLRIARRLSGSNGSAGTSA